MMRLSFIHPPPPLLSSTTNISGSAGTQPVSSTSVVSASGNWLIQEYSVSVILEQSIIALPFAIMESDVTTHSCSSAGISARVTVTVYSSISNGTVIDCVVSPVDQRKSYSQPAAGLVTIAVSSNESPVALQVESISTEN